MFSTVITIKTDNPVVITSGKTITVIRQDVDRLSKKTSEDSNKHKQIHSKSYQHTTHRLSPKDLDWE